RIQEAAQAHGGSRPWKTGQHRCQHSRRRAPRAQSRERAVTTITREDLVTPVTLQHDLERATYLLAQEIQRNIGGIAKRLVVRAYEPPDDIRHVMASDEQLMVVGAERIG